MTTDPRKKKAEEYADTLMMMPNDAYREGITDAHLAGQRCGYLEGLRAALGRVEADANAYSSEREIKELIKESEHGEEKK